jgi:N-acetylglucosamine-6-sulfatase
VLLLTDDQDLRLGSNRAMSFAQQQLTSAGANLSNYFVHTPICCPSRTTLLSGRYVQNNRVETNEMGGCMRMNTSRADNPGWWESSLVPALHAAGYETGMFGKVLNKMNTYGCDQGWHSLPPGVSAQAIM